MSTAGPFILARLASVRTQNKTILPVCKNQFAAQAACDRDHRGTCCTHALAVDASLLQNKKNTSLSVSYFHLAVWWRPQTGAQWRAGFFFWAAFRLANRSQAKVGLLRGTLRSRAHAPRVGTRPGVYPAKAGHPPPRVVYSGISRIRQNQR
ncbi:MAG: hypothetical protein IM602_01710 [Cytophagales bacterium]|nr:hypothetical protein [Cytophagales bacterium]MCA6389497.1 hypothetical protein [Cytophagales bacterium]MCA6391835.1 hypothetical protein [Cytophagales bacterium]MCA6403331.1 hypothetical protein [Cytophagales bacterium]MCA6414975.1 hypothetical protein [Cytophagales bacterium]